MQNWLPTKHFLTITSHHMDGQCSRCHTLETTIHISRDYPQAKESWANPWDSYPWPFFTCFYKSGFDIMQLRQQLLCPINFHCEFISLSFAGIYGQSGMNESSSSISVPAWTCSFLCASSYKILLPGWLCDQSQVRILYLIRWNVPPDPNIKLNTDGSVIGNLGLAGAGGLLRDSSGEWISSFSLHLGLASNNMAELAAVRQGLAIAWALGFIFIQLELDSTIVLTRLTEKNATYPANMRPLICDCRNLMDREWEVQVLHTYHEANAIADALAKRGTYQQHILFIYSSCPNFVYVCYVRDSAGHETNRLCA